MTRTLSAVGLSLTIFLTSLSATAAPARADEDVAKVLAGLALLGIIASVANKRDEPVARKHPPHRPVVTPRPVPSLKVAPRRCLQKQWTHRGTRTVYAAGCMQHASKSAPPRACLQAARTKSGPTRFYSPGCLRKHGWRA